MECTLATPHQAMSHSSLYLRSVRARSDFPAASSSSGRIRIISTASISGDVRQLALRTTDRTGRLLQLGAELLSGKPLGELNLLSSSAWKANARSETTLADDVRLMNAGWLHFAVTTGWWFMPGQAFGEEAISDAASVLEQVVQSESGASIVDQAGGTGSGLDQVGGASVVEQVVQSDTGASIVDQVGGTGSGLDQVVEQVVQSDAGAGIVDPVAGTGSGLVVDKAMEIGAASADLVTAAGPAEPTDPFDAVASGTVSLLFVLSFLALLALTIGVGYLAISEFRERKEAEKEKLARGPAKKVEDLSLDVVRGKGFGRKVEKLAKEKSRK